MFTAVGLGDLQKVDKFERWFLAAQRQTKIVSSVADLGYLYRACCLIPKGNMEFLFATALPFI